MKLRSLCAGAATALLLALSAMPAHAFETISTACAKKNGSAFYNIVPDGGAAKKCAAGDQQVRFIEVVDTSAYRKFRGTALLDSRMLGRVGGIEVWLWEDGGSNEFPCSFEIAAVPSQEPAFMVNLLTNVDRLGGENINQREELNSDIGDGPYLLRVPIGKAMLKAGPVAYLLPNGAMYTFTDIFINSTGIGKQRCFGSVTVKQDLVTRAFAK